MLTWFHGTVLARDRNGGQLIGSFKLSAGEIRISGWDKQTITEWSSSGWQLAGVLFHTNTRSSNVFGKMAIAAASMR